MFNSQNCFENRLKRKRNKLYFCVLFNKSYNFSKYKQIIAECEDATFMAKNSVLRIINSIIKFSQNMIDSLLYFMNFRKDSSTAAQRVPLSCDWMDGLLLRVTGIETVAEFSIKIPCQEMQHQ